MTTGRQTALRQRLDQHADAMEAILDRLDQIDRTVGNLFRQVEPMRRRVRELESIVLPDHDRPTAGRPSEPPS